MTDTPPRAVSLSDVQTAYPFLRERVIQTPLIASGGVSEHAGCERVGASLRLKMENQQRTGAFKIRGATWKTATLSPDEKARGIVSASAGNHGQGVALAARDAGIVATVFVPRTASIAKIAAMEGYGASVRLDGAEFADADIAARKYAGETGATFIPAFDDDAIITGQGSLGLELLADAPDVETVLLPIGGGGLFAHVIAIISSDDQTVRAERDDDATDAVVRDKFFRRRERRFRCVYHDADQFRRFVFVNDKIRQFQVAFTNPETSVSFHLFNRGSGIVKLLRRNFGAFGC